MALVHVVAVERGHAKGPQHPDAADAQDDLLAEPHAVVAPVQRIGEAAVLLGVLRDIRVDQEHADG